MLRKRKARALFGISAALFTIGVLFRGLRPIDLVLRGRNLDVLSGLLEVDKSSRFCPTTIIITVGFNRHPSSLSLWSRHRQRSDVFPTPADATNITMWQCCVSARASS